MHDYDNYHQILADIKQRVNHAQVRALMGVNAQMIKLYWDIGELLDAKQAVEGWGSGVIPQLAQDLHNELPEIKGFSEQNIQRMLSFYREYPDFEKMTQSVSQMILSLPCGHHIE